MVEELLMGPLLVQLLPTPVMMAMCWWETVQGPVRPLEHGVEKSHTVLKVNTHIYVLLQLFNNESKIRPNTSWYIDSIFGKGSQLVFFCVSSFLSSTGHN